MVASLKQGNQVMVFVHSRKDTVKTARALAEHAAAAGQTELFLGDDTHASWGLAKRDVAK